MKTWLIHVFSFYKGEAMLKVQEYLMKHNSLEQLEKDYAVSATHSPIGEPLVALNYCQIDSPKHSPITKECRGLVLDKTDWSVVAKPFSRFFNYGESREEINKFDWNSFATQNKEDGSLIIVYNYKGTWRVNTRASFGIGKINNSNYTWEELFYQTINEKQLDYVPENTTLVFELCSIYNKVVRTYLEPTSFLLASFNRETLEEDKQESVAQYAKLLNVPCPPLLTYGCVDDILKTLETTEPTFEGFVIKDINGNRMKIKSKNYLRLHRMRGNGDNLFAPKNLIPFILQNETGELIAIYPEVKPYLLRYEMLLAQHQILIEEVWSKIWNRNTQKSFALKVMELCPRWSSILFQCRKENKWPAEIWRKSSDYILKVLDKELTECYTKPLNPNELEIINVQQHC